METLIQREKITEGADPAGRRTESLARIVARQIADVINHSDLDFGALFSASYLIFWGLYFLTCSLVDWHPNYLMPLFRHIDGETLAVICASAGACQMCGMILSRAYQQNYLRTWSALAAGLVWIVIALIFVQSVTMLPLFVGHFLLALACLNGFRRFRAP